MSSWISRAALLSTIVLGTGCDTNRAGLFGMDGHTTAQFDATGARDGGGEPSRSGSGGASQGSGGATASQGATGGVPYDDYGNGLTTRGDAGGYPPVDAGTTVEDGGVGDGSTAYADGSSVVVPCPNPVWYPDDDGDHYGRSTAAVNGCAPPKDGTWAPIGGDCDDDNSLVNPGQTTYFGVPYAAANGQSSFDYDCSGMEMGDPAQVLSPLCEALSLGCTGSGYVAVANAATTGNPLCGSTTMATCTPGIFCMSVTSTVDTPYRCR